MAENSKSVSLIMISIPTFIKYLSSSEADPMGIEIGRVIQLLFYWEYCCTKDRMQDRLFMLHASILYILQFPTVLTIKIDTFLFLHSIARKESISSEGYNRLSNRLCRYLLTYIVSIQLEYEKNVLPDFNQILKISC